MVDDPSEPTGRRKNPRTGGTAGHAALGSDERDRDEIVKTVLALREQKRTLKQICSDLTLRGFTPQRGGRWFPAQIKRIAGASREMSGRTTGRQGERGP